MTAPIQHGETQLLSVEELKMDCIRVNCNNDLDIGKHIVSMTIDHLAAANLLVTRELVEKINGKKQRLVCDEWDDGFNDGISAVLRLLTGEKNG